LIVYSRKKKSGKEIEHTTPLVLDQEADPSSIPTQVHSGKENSTFENPTFVMDDLDVPIAVRKGVRIYTNHPTGRFVSYGRLSPSY